MGVYAEEAPSGFAFETITVANSAIGCTAATANPSNAPGAVRAVMTLETAQIRYRYDGTDPTSTVGHLLEIGETLVLEGADNIRRFKAIRTGSTSGALSTTYER